jgi:O-antigen/teichoic acid export membrane protein
MINRANRFTPKERPVFFLWVKQRLRKMTVLAAIALFVFLPVGLQQGVELATYLCFTATVLVSVLALFPKACLQVKFSTRWILVSECVSLLIVVLCIAGAYYIALDPLVGFWFGSFLGQLLAWIMMTRVSLLLSNGMSALEKATLDEIRCEGRHMLKGAAASTTGSRMQAFVLGVFASSSAVAGFGVANSLAGPLRMLSGGISVALRPRLSRIAATDEVQRFNSYFYKIFGALLVIGLVAIAAAFGLSNILIELVFGGNYAYASSLLPLAMIWVCLDALTTLLMIALQIRVKSGAAIAARLRIEAAICSIVLLIPGCMNFGASGAFFVLIIAELWYGGRALFCLKPSFLESPVYSESALNSPKLS